ncbi:MAG: hypothetical protein K2O73_04695, partial [Lachnospiraceae bacterium]|nr:hypothetical protein [Lachnospiraceae bacterium]
MGFLNKMERKLGRFAISNLMLYVIGAYVIGYAILMLRPEVLGYLVLSPYHILHGQVWRLFTWVLVPNTGSLFSLLIMALLYYQLGGALERAWGTFRFNAYIFGGMLFMVIGAFIMYGVMYLMNGGVTVAMLSIGLHFSTAYINMSIFLAFAAMFPNMQIMLMFIIPIKMKWMAFVYAAITVYQLIYTGWDGRVAIIMSLLNFLIFFLSTRNYKRVSPKEIHRRQAFKAQMRQPRPGSGITKHKCAICGRTELD